MRKTAHVFGIVTLERRPGFLYQFATVFNGITFLAFLKEIVRRSRRRKTFSIIDNGPCHNLAEDGKLWLASHRHRIELFRLPPYSQDHRRARRRAMRDVRHVPSEAGADRESRGQVPVIHNQHVPV
jgi:hypothetical protein